MLFFCSVALCCTASQKPSEVIWQDPPHQTAPPCFAGSERCQGRQCKQRRVSMTAARCMDGSAGLLRHSHGCAMLRRPRVSRTGCRRALNAAWTCCSRRCNAIVHSQGHGCGWSAGSTQPERMQQPSEGRKRHRSSLAAAPAAQEGAAGLAGLLQAIQAQLQGQAPSGEPAGADLEVQHLTYHPAGAASSCAMPAIALP